MSQIKKKVIDKAPWLGEVPHHWRHMKVSHLGTLGRGRVISNLELISEGKYPVYSSQTFRKGEMGRINTYDFEGEYVTWTTDGANAGTVFSRTGKFNCTNVCGTIKPKKDISTKYLAYALSIETKRYVRLDINPKLMNTEMAQIRVVVPPRQNQEMIELFLDKKTTEIDNLITDKERLIELLEEKRQAVITETVTKGLDPNVEMKYSGIEWIGEIPEHWDLIKLKYIFNIKNGGTPKSNELRYWDDNGIIWITPGDLSSPGFRISDSKNKISEEGLNNSSANYISKDSIVMSTRAPIGNMKLATKNYTTNQGCKSLEMKNNNINVLFYFYLLRFKKEVLQSLGQGTTFLELSNNSLKNFQVPITSINEQTNIINIIEKLNTDIESTLKKIKNQISKLKEYRESLIYEAVTGKIDVRDYATKTEEVY